ncbi:predicted protein [Histoplasma capsulatum G186AR]|uniref:Uncharacterized protein n=1 Tax=Ajellomyces capsulatus (strain G186AR / H82 / ATCC MYA-2454 / RMSCC 2432) TaxID=447093 RepID=C0NBY5_AJECG|nr:uncharacterized protein HCBG_00631 [Histoplasma capsulatum G186AR]EEH11176.1 predicted protein [Histoplasma capsulatum G186AR]
MRGIALQTAVPGVKRREITEENNRRHLGWRGPDQRLWISIVNRCKYLVPSHHPVSNEPRPRAGLEPGQDLPSGVRLVAADPGANALQNHRGMYPVPEHQVALAIIVFIDWSFVPFQPLGGLEKQLVLTVAHSQGCGCTGG